MLERAIAAISASQHRNDQDRRQDHYQDHYQDRGVRVLELRP
ncbi:MAG: hypothetical protein NTZ53_03400 [Cyanobacteria bacterium]|nr:hypothetical protein [Cyanobacteriota bacterium]